jgi:hypothetical protein
MSRLNGADGRITGYASVFGRLDEVGDVVLPGAFKRTLAEGGRIKMLLAHDPAKEIGRWETIHEDGFGLYVEGVVTAYVPPADYGLSIGFKTVKSRKGEWIEAWHRFLIDVDLYDISLVLHPAQAAARLLA